MTASDGKPFVYEKAQLLEVICQLRYPTILSIDAKTPADFQDTVRASFPRYQLKLERVPGPEGKTEEVRNHNFISADGTYKIAMTKNFIALSTMRYTRWEDFARTLDEPLGQFIRIYRPAYKNVSTERTYVPMEERVEQESIPSVVEDEGVTTAGHSD